MAVEQWTVERLDRLAELVERNSQAIDRNSLAIDERLNRLAELTERNSLTIDKLTQESEKYAQESKELNIRFCLPASFPVGSEFSLWLVGNSHHYYYCDSSFP